MNCIGINNNQIRNGMPIEQFIRAMKRLGKLRGDEAQLDQSLGLLFIDENNGLEANGRAEFVSMGGKAMLVMLHRNSVLSVNTQDGDLWHFFNDPTKSALTASRAKPVPLVIDSPVLAWLTSGEVGASSKTMCQRLFDMPGLIEHEAHPRDPADLLRCRKFVRATGCEAALDEMRAVSPEWRTLIEHWSELGETMDAEVDWMTAKLPSGKSAAHTYDAMQELLSGSDFPAIS